MKPIRCVIDGVWQSRMADGQPGKIGSKVRIRTLPGVESVTPAWQTYKITETFEHGGETYYVLDALAVPVRD